MFFRKKTQLVGLDIGSSVIKAAEIVDTKTGYVLKKFGTIDVEPEIIEEGAIKDPETVSASIRELFKANKMKNQNVAISISIKLLVGVLAALGLVNLWIAIGVGDMGLTFAVIVNALRLVRKQ